MCSTDDIMENTKFLDLYPNQYVLRQQNQMESVVIDFMSGNISKEKQIGSGNKKSTIGIKAVYGIIELTQLKYLMVATKSNQVASIYDKRIYQLTEMQFFPIAPDQKIRDVDLPQINMLQELFRTNFFYFSDQYDLTSSFQQFINKQADKNQFNPNYCYNENCLEPFIKIGAFEWIAPFITGYVSDTYHEKLNFILISRRDKRRVGLRFMSRGTDLDGNCSNMAEQEQILVLFEHDKNITTIYSHVQTRGSMPFKWRQTPTLKWAPKGYVMGTDQENQEICHKHFQDQCRSFPKQTLINLVDKKGTQKMLGSYFEKMIDGLNNKNIRYIWFDFHAECKKMQYQNLSRLLAQIPTELEKYGYFHISYNTSNISAVEIHKQQIGVFRTNCMDCLDRTNVVQSVICRQIVHKVLHLSNIVETPTGDPFQKFPGRLEDIFRSVWTRNADVMSILYSGTGALKTDFTRTGKRTKQGALQDGKNSIHRYFLNNFYDGAKQDTYQLLLGKLNPKKHKISKPLINPVYVILGLTIFMYFFLGNMSKTYLNPLFLSDQQQLENQTQGSQVHQGGIMASISEFIFISSGIVIFLKMLQKGNKLFVSSPILKA